MKTDSSLAEIFIEFKWDTADDPFSTGASLIHGTIRGDDSLGQITSYVAVQLGAQFRTHAYFVFVLRGTARILRWDRSGMIVTEAFEYNTLPYLTNFFRRYSLASQAMRGKDDTASDPTPSEAHTTRKALGLDRKVPLVKLSIPGTNSNLLYFVTGTPEASVYTPPGRATHGFEAYDISHSRTVFLKDSWRIDAEGIQPEGEVYQTLRSANVPHVPHCLASGDVSTGVYHSTTTWKYASATWAQHSHTSSTHFLSHRHYRLALDIIGRILVDFHSSYEMVGAV